MVSGLETCTGVIAGSKPIGWVIEILSGCVLAGKNKGLLSCAGKLGNAGCGLAPSDRDVVKFEPNTDELVVVETGPKSPAFQSPPELGTADGCLSIVS